MIIGVGNDYRSDDRVGLVVTRKLKTKPIPQTRVIETSGEGTALMEAWQEAATVILVDAMSSGAIPGTIHRFNAQAQPIPAKFFHTSTHAFAVAEAIELARALNQLPPGLIVYGIEGKNFAVGTEFSPEVEKAIPNVIEQVLQDIRAIRRAA
jgi:hydrogenase maturation protease